MSAAKQYRMIQTNALGERVESAKMSHTRAVQRAQLAHLGNEREVRNYTEAGLPIPVRIATAVVTVEEA